MLSIERRYDIDWLRVIAIGLLLIYHIAIGFQPWGVFIQFIQSKEPLEVIWVPMSLLNVWRIPLLFFVSGMGVCFAISKRDWMGLIKERALRIFLPFVFGMLAIVPLHVFLWQDYYRQEIQYNLLNPGHLWFLGNLFVYVLVLSPLFFYLKKNHNGKIRLWIEKFFKTPFALIIVCIPFVIESLIVDPEGFEVYAMTSHGFWLGLLAFFFGFCFVYSGKSFWLTVKKWKWITLALAFSLYLVRLIVFEMKGLNYLLSIESNLWVFSILGLGYSYLNKPSKALSYLSQAAYPVYIIHMVFLYLGSWLFFELNIPTTLQFILVVLFTITGCMITYEFLIRRVKFLRPLFGLKID